MKNYFQIDPESLAIHVQASILQRDESADLFLVLLDRCMVGNFDEAVTIVRGLPEGQEKSRAVELLSQYVHEIRHHVDLLLTPYGCYRIRHTLETMVNLLYLTRSKEFSTLPIPLSLAADPLNLKFLGLDPATIGSLGNFATLLDSRRRVVAEDNLAFQAFGGVLRMGGESMLEGLAYYAQRAWIGTTFKNEFYQTYFDYLIRPQIQSPLTFKYNWPAIVFAELADGSKHSISPPFIEPFVNGLLLIGLNGSVLPKRKEPQRSSGLNLTKPRDVSDFMPCNRLCKIIDGLKTYRMSIHSSQDILDNLMSLSEHLFGLSYIDELRIDINLNEILVEEYCVELEKRLPSDLAVAALYRSFCERRALLFEKFLNNPLEFIVAHFFSTQIKQAWVPDHIYFFDHGMRSGDNVPVATTINRQMVGLHSISMDMPQESGDIIKEKICFSCWVRPDDIEGTLHLEADADDGKAYFYGYLLPIHKFLMNGYNYRAMSDVELVHANELLSHHRNIILDPEFEKANRVFQTSALRSSPKQNFCCDRCNRQMILGECATVSPLTVRQNSMFWSSLKGEVLSRIGDAADSLTATAFFNLTFGVDWSDWILCDACLDHFEFRTMQFA